MPHKRIGFSDWPVKLIEFLLTSWVALGPKFHSQNGNLEFVYCVFYIIIDNYYCDQLVTMCSIDWSRLDLRKQCSASRHTANNRWRIALNLPNSGNKSGLRADVWLNVRLMSVSKKPSLYRIADSENTIERPTAFHFHWYVDSITRRASNNE